MSSKPLTKQQQAMAKVCFSFTIVALVLRKLKEIADIPDDTRDPAISQCVALIDDILEPLEENERKAVIDRVNKARRSFSKSVHHYPAEAGLVGSLEVVTSGLFKTRVGTRLDYIVNTFAKNLDSIKENMEYDEQKASAFASKFKKTIKRI